LPTAESHWKTGFDAGHIYSQRMRVFPKAEPMNSGTAPNRKFVGAKVLGDRVNGLGLPGGPGHGVVEVFQGPDGAPFWRKR